MTVTSVVIGVDVGGTNTDAVLLDKNGKEACVISQAKTYTTSDVTNGVQVAIHLALINTRKENRPLAVQQVNVGTTHFINAIVEGKGLSKVSVIRLCGTASRKLPPFSDFPEHLTDIIKGSVHLVGGGYQFDGSEIESINEDEIIHCVEQLKNAKEKNIVVSGIFSPVRQQQEDKVVELISGIYPEASITASHQVGKIGLLERENAAILNESIKQLCRQTIAGLRGALADIGLRCPMYLTQNDGTIIDEEQAIQFPVMTFASGMTNSMRGAAFLSNLSDAIVVDIGGTSTDVGVLLKGFPREASSEVMVGGVKTNFRMPDVISIGLGGGSYVNETKDAKGDLRITVGPRSAGYNIRNEALVFAKPTDTNIRRNITATDIAVASNIASLETANTQNLKHLRSDLIDKATCDIHDKVSRCIDQMRFNDRDLPLILVGGGSIIIDRKFEFGGISNIITPDNFDVANAVGAALSQISTTIDRVVDLGNYSEIKDFGSGTENASGEPLKDEEKAKESVRKEILEKARILAMDAITQEAESNIMAAGVKPESIIVVEKDDVTLAYIPGNAVRIRLKVVGDLQTNLKESQSVVEEEVFTRKLSQGQQRLKQSVTSTGKMLMDEDVKLIPSDPHIDPQSGEWLISEYDVECISIGAGILGCGGGGNPYIGKLLAIKMLRENKTIRVFRPSKFLQDVHPENDLVTLVAFMGAPLILYEKLVSGNETTEALRCIQDIYRYGGYNDGGLVSVDGVKVEEKSGVKYIDDYKIDKKGHAFEVELGNKKIVAIMCAEVGGMNSIEPLLVGGELDIPILDCDGMGRAFPGLQMFCPFMYGCRPYPCTLADDKGRRAVVLKSDSPKLLENHFRDVVISMGCSGGIVLSHFNKDEVMHKTVHHSISHAWRIGDTIIKARTSNESPVKRLTESENGKLLIYGKISDVLRETTGGFNKGKLLIDGLDECRETALTIDFQNEFLLAKVNSSGEVLACVPDLISIMDPDTAQPIATEEIRFGIRVVVVAFRAHPLISSETALNFVGPQAFGYPEDVKYQPLCNYQDIEPVPPE